MNTNKVIAFVADAADAWKPSARRTPVITEHLESLLDAVDAKDPDQVKHHGIMAVDLMEMDNGVDPEPESQSAVARLSRAVEQNLTRGSGE